MPSESAGYETNPRVRALKLARRTAQGSCPQGRPPRRTLERKTTMVTQEQQSIIDHAQLQKINGWQHIKVKGTPYECGFQEG